jgi:hypothetical protein
MKSFNVWDEWAAGTRGRAPEPKAGPVTR